MAPNRKKKKANSNPARGYTTVSLPSKTETPSSTDSPAPAVQTLNTSESNKPVGEEAPPQGSSSTLEKQDTQELQNLSPEELERHLEEAELQLIVDKYATKCKNDASRHALRLVTEKRVLRSQATPLNLKGWLSPEILEEILARESVEKPFNSTRDLEPNGEFPLSMEEEICVNMWTLRLILLEIGFQEDSADEALKNVLMFGSLEPTSGKDSIWNLNHALDFLGLYCDKSKLAPYEETKSYIKADQIIQSGQDIGNITMKELSGNEGLDLPSIGSSALDNQGSENSSGNLRHNSYPSTPSSGASDMEPEMLIPQYVELQSRLYNLDPEIFNKAKRLQKKTASNNGGDSRLNPEISKLKRKIAIIEKDVLFDFQEAEEEWKQTLSELRRTTGENLQKAIGDNVSSSEILSTEPQEIQSDIKHGIEINPNALEADEGEEDILGGIFFSEPSPPATDAPTMGDSANTIMKFRDFGKSLGMNPRKILEDACRARDPGYKISYRNLSCVPHSHRKVVEIKWSKNQSLVFDSPLCDISYKLSPDAVIVSMTSISAATSLQAESYISTIALFILCGNSPKESKVSMKLAGVWKDEWEQLAQAKKERQDETDRAVYKSMKDVLQEFRNQLDDDVVLSHNFKQRNGMGRDTPLENSVQSKQNHYLPPDHLQNIWANKASSALYDKMLRTRMNLPIWPFKQKVMDVLANNQAIIICGQTGSGKSTQIPSFILENELSSGRSCKIYVTEPRRISAISLARRVSDELGERKDDIGTERSLVGYAIRLESKLVASTRLVFATTGVVIRMLERPQAFQDVTHLVLDEVHERTIDSDFLLIVLRRLLRTRTDLKLILMSATVDAQRFSAYLQGAPILDIPGRTFPVETKYLEDAVELTHHKFDDQQPATYTEDTDTSSPEESNTTADGGLRSSLSKYSKQTRETVSSLNEYHLNYKLVVNLLSKIATQPELEIYSKAILIFMPGLAEIRRLHDEILSERLFQQGWVIYSLHSSIASEDQERAFVVPPRGMRKIVIATNIAETGITIPDITAVIDTGKEKVMRFDERRQISKLVESFISRANAKQRRGRAGRVQKGICFHLFTKNRHDKLLAEQQSPEMLRLSLQDLILRVKICNLGDIEETLSEALDPPSSKNVRRAIEALKTVKALTGAEALTSLGKRLAKLPLDVFLGKLILYGTFFKCLDAAVSIAAILSCKSPFTNTTGTTSQRELARKAFKRGNSDLLTVYSAYCGWKKHRADRNEYNFCRKNSLSPQAMLNIEDVKTQLIVSIVDAGLLQLTSAEQASLNRARYTGRKRQFFTVPERVDINSDNDLMMNSVIAWSFYPRLLTRSGKGWRNISNNQSIVLHSTSVNKHSDVPLKWLSYYHIMQSRNRNYNAHETSVAGDLAIALFCGDVEFKLFAGVISIDGNRIRFKVKDWKSMIALKALSNRIRDILAQTFRNPKKELSSTQKAWLEIWQQVFSPKKEPEAPEITM